jgi:putative heme-binding domain-containing protein
MRRLSLLLLLLVPVTTRAAEPAFTPPDGLELWLDATRLDGKDGSPVARWPDASPRQRHLTQTDVGKQPKLLRRDALAFVRFDGIDDHLRHISGERTAEGATIFIVASPHSNPGDFRAFLAANAKERRDYETGFTIDQSAAATPRFGVVNVEGAGFGGAVNLCDQTHSFGSVHLLEAVVDPGKKQVTLAIDGKACKSRPFQGVPLRLDELTVGARYYTNGPGKQEVRGFLAGDLCEVLIFNRALPADQVAAVRSYLQKKWAALKETQPSVGVGVPLTPVENPPPVQFFVPGYTVRQLPVDLTNINNVCYRDDGVLVALAYDGNIYLLDDPEGKGIESRVRLFWEGKGKIIAPIGMALTPKGYARGRGVVLACKGKVLMVLDTDGDDKADKEIVVAEGWKELPHGVDALGVAFDPKDQSIYFGLGCADYTNAYQVDGTGKAGYRLDSERGTIQRVSPDLKKRETICTGVRFSVGLTFNRQGDLFATDQEGATWLPDGNPFDELLHIERGRHYGFPPRHPKHLPNVHDEPSVFDYGPQHQSTCGLCFNEQGDAVISGYSRGKLYRTQLVKTPAGYVAANHLLASSTMLLVDTCVGPKGELVLSCHSGGPDWGSGPAGKGKLFKATYTPTPQPVAVWPAGPREVHIAFDKPLDPATLPRLGDAVKLQYGTYVRAGDAFEVQRPGYAVVQMQQATPRFDLPVHSVSLTPDRRTLILATAPHRQPGYHAITLPRADSERRKDDLPQHPRIDLDYTLNGVEATWTPATGDPLTLWLPHLDLAVARAFTRGSAQHDAFWAAIEKPGTLTLRTRLDLTSLLHPAVQPGSNRGRTWPEEPVTLELVGPVVSVEGWPGTATSEKRSDGKTLTRLQLPANADHQPTVTLKVTTRATLDLAYRTGDDKPRALSLHRLTLPWAPRPGETPPVVRSIPEIEGGSWARGRRVFFDSQAACARCHTIHGQGTAIGPDLTNLIHRDYASVLRDIASPSYAINPDHITHLVETTDGRVFTGVVRTVGAEIHIGDSQGRITKLRKEQVESMQPTPHSTMPEGLPQVLGPERMKDLLTFLLTAPAMPADHPGPFPPPRARADVLAALAGSTPVPEKPAPLHILLVTGPKDHGPGEHDYPAWQRVWAELLGGAAGVTLSKASPWPTEEQWKAADIVVLYQQGTWDERRAGDVDGFLARGGGLVLIHYAVDGGKDSPGFAQRIGLAWQGGQSKFRHGPLDLDLAPGKDHPITRNLSSLKFLDESYWKLVGDPGGMHILATGREDGQAQPLFWTTERGKGRVFVSIPGHFSWTFDDPLYRLLLLRGMLWTARAPVDRFNDLVWPGARVAE